MTALVDAVLVHLYQIQARETPSPAQTVAGIALAVGQKAQTRVLYALQYLIGAALVEREKGRVVGARKKVWTYRITTKGFRLVAGRERLLRDSGLEATALTFRAAKGDRR